MSEKRETVKQETRIGLASLICGILGLFVTFFSSMALFLGVFGVLKLKDKRARSYAAAGLALGIAEFVLLAIVMLTIGVR